METLYWTIFYVILARACKFVSKTVQIHSIVHCFMAAFVSGVAFYQVIGNEVFKLDAYRQIITSVSEEEGKLLKRVAYHSCGYFIGDTIDIYIDYTNKKRKEYVFHHIASAAGLCTVYMDSYISLWGLWLFEVGGCVHHIKHAAKVWELSAPWDSLSEVLYHTVYLTSRMFLFVNTTFSWFYVFEMSATPAVDIVCCIVVYILVVQNTIWWYKNFRATKTGRQIQRSFTEAMVYSYDEICRATSMDGDANVVVTPIATRSSTRKRRQASKGSSGIT
jgi:hypothetical protein